MGRQRGPGTTDKRGGQGVIRQSNRDRQLCGLRRPVKQGVVFLEICGGGHFDNLHR